MFAEIAYTIDENNDVTWGEFRVYPDSPISDSDVLEIYTDVTNFISINAIDANWLHTQSEDNSGMFICEYINRYSSDGTNVTHLSDVLINRGTEGAWMY
jgi:hypothetical protein